MKRFLMASSILALLAVPCIGQQKTSPEGKIDLRILYAGMPESARKGTLSLSWTSTLWQSNPLISALSQSSRLQGAMW